MHYTGTIWRPPYEAGHCLLKLLLAVRTTNANSALCMMIFRFNFVCRR